MRLLLLRPRHTLLFLLLFMTYMAARPNPGHTARTFNVRDGLPSNSVSSIAQDDNGLIWIGTWNGLSFYDGYRFFTFRSGQHNGDLTTNRILRLLPDSIGNIWFITYDHRLNMLDNPTGQFKSVGDIMEDDSAVGFDADELYKAGNCIYVSNRAGTQLVKIAYTGDDGRPYDISIKAISEVVPGARHFENVYDDGAGRFWILTDNAISLAGGSLTVPGRFAGVAAAGDETYLVERNGKCHVWKDGRQLRQIPPLTGFGSVNSFKVSDESHIAVGTDRGYAVYNIKHRKWTTTDISSGVESVNVDSTHRVWLYTGDGRIAYASGDTRPVFPAVSGLDDKSATSFVWPFFLEDNYGTVWMAPAEGQLAFFDETARRVTHSQIVLPLLKYTVLPEVEKFFVDNNNNLWVISVHGLSLINFNYQNYRNMPVDKNQETRSLLAFDDGSLLAGSAKGVIARYSSDGKLKGFLRYQPSAVGSGKVSLSSTPVNFSDKVYAMFRDRNDNVWVGTKGDGLYVIDKAGMAQHYMRQYPSERHISCDTIYDFSYDTRGNMWLGTYGYGLQLVKPRGDGSYEFVDMPRVNKSYPEEEGYEYVRRITHNRKGEVALSCNKGLLTFSDDFRDVADIEFRPTMAISGDENSLRTSNVMQVLVAKDGTTLVTTMGGEVQRLAGDNLADGDLRFEPLSNPELAALLSHVNVLSMIQDNRGNYYFVRESDIVAYFPVERSIVMLGRNVLGGEQEFTEAMPAVGPDGSLYFGAVGSVVKVDPAEVAKEPFAPNIIFTGLQFEGDSRERFILNPENIVLQPDHRNFALSFASLDYSGYGRIEYAYRFDPDTAWTLLGTSNVLQLTNLTPGVHRLYIRSTNGDGTWVDNQKYVDIMVKPTFGETIWAKILWGAIVLAVVLFLIHYYNVYRRNKLIKLMHQREHDFYVDASHKLRTPLSLIGSPVYEVLKHENLSDTGREHLERVRRNAKNMLHVLNTMLEAEFRSSGLYDEQSAGSMAPENKPSYMKSENWLEVKEGREVSVQKDVKILIVEDDDDLCGFLRDILSSQYTIITASNGKEGLEKAEAEQPDFILTDVTMPEMDGMTMVKIIKSKKQLSHIPIIVLSAKASMDDRVEGLRVGIDDYISKPFSATYLRQRIANIIAQRRLLQQAMFEQLGNDMNNSGGGAGKPTAAGRASDGVPEKQEYRLEAPQIVEADQVMMEKLMKFLEQRIGDENLRIEEMADAVSMGRTVFYGKIKTIVGMSPSDFLRTLRMQRAEELIVKSKMNFSQIAFSVGFSDPKYFTKCFKKETGLTPSEYRQQKSGERSK